MLPDSQLPPAASCLCAASKLLASQLPASGSLSGGSDSREAASLGEHWDSRVPFAGGEVIFRDPQEGEDALHV